MGLEVEFGSSRPVGEAGECIAEVYTGRKVMWTVKKVT